MITETFLNSCFTVILNNNTKIRRDKTLYRDISDTLTNHKDKEKGNIPVNIQNKFDCLLKICEMKLVDKSDDNIIDSISYSEKYKKLIDFIQIKRGEEVTDEFVLDNIKQIRMRKKLDSLFQNHGELGTFLDSIKDGSFESLDDLASDYEGIVRKLYTSMMDSNRRESIAATSSLDLAADDYDQVLDTILRKYERSNTTSTGFHILDNEVLNGGFEPSRIYVFGGSSGSGKSTLMLNMMVNAATTPFVKIDVENEKLSMTKNVYVYVTMENTVEESLIRLYQSLFNKSIVHVIRDVKEGVDIKQSILNELDKSNSTIVMHYFPAASISALDIMRLLDDVKEIYGKDSVRGIYIDYLDLLKSDIQNDLYRIELGNITVSLKSLAIEYNIPVITATQLGRSTYRINNAHELGLDQVGESIKKVENADFVALLSKDPIDDTKVHFKVGKNRSGKAGVSLGFDVNFEIFKFMSASKVSNSKKQDATNEESLGFDGLNNF